MAKYCPKKKTCEGWRNSSKCQKLIEILNIVKHPAKSIGILN